MRTEKRALKFAINTLKSNESVTRRRTLIEIYGDMRVLIENHHGIRCYSHEKILVCTCEGYIAIHGEQLNFRNMDKEKLVVTGRIFSIDLHGVTK